MQYVSKTISTEDTWTDWLEPNRAEGTGRLGNLAVSITPDGSFSGTVTVQRTFDGGTTVKDVDSYTSQQERNLDDPSENVMYRAGIKSGDISGGSVDIELRK